MSTSDDDGLPTARARQERRRGPDELFGRVAPWSLLGCAIALVGLFITPGTVAIAALVVLGTVLAFCLVVVVGACVLMGCKEVVELARGPGLLRVIAYVVPWLCLVPFGIVAPVLIVVHVASSGAPRTAIASGLALLCILVLYGGVLRGMWAIRRTQQIARQRGPDGLYRWLVERRPDGGPPDRYSSECASILRSVGRADLQLDVLERFPVSKERRHDHKQWTTQRVLAALQLGEMDRARQIAAREDLEDRACAGIDVLILALEGRGAAAIEQLDNVESYVSPPTSRDVDRAHALAAMGRNEEAIAALASTDMLGDVQWPTGPATPLLEEAARRWRRERQES